MYYLGTTTTYYYYYYYYLLLFTTLYKSFLFFFFFCFEKGMYSAYIVQGNYHFFFWPLAGKGGHILYTYHTYSTTTTGVRSVVWWGSKESMYI